MRGCWTEDSVPVAELQKAYSRTLRLKYGEKEVTKFDQLMKKELEKINSKAKK